MKRRIPDINYLINKYAKNNTPEDYSGVLSNK